MDNATIVEILLGVLAAAVGWAGWASSSRANKTEAVGVPADVEADAYQRARNIYEGAIQSLEGQMIRLRDEIQSLNGEVSRLRESNTALLEQVDDLKIHNRQLLVQISETHDVNKELMAELERARGQEGVLT